MKKNRIMIMILILLVAMVNISCSLTDKLIERGKTKLINVLTGTSVPLENGIDADELSIPTETAKAEQAATSNPIKEEVDTSIIDVDLSKTLKFFTTDFENSGFIGPEIPETDPDPVEVDNSISLDKKLPDYKYLVEEGERITGWFYTMDMRFDKICVIIFDKYPDKFAAENAVLNKSVLGKLVDVKNKQDLGENAKLQTESGFTVLDFSYRNFQIQIMAPSDNTDAVENLAVIIKKRMAELPTKESITISNEPFSPTVVEPGIYLVGVDIAPGIYRNDGNSDSCYWKKTDKVGEIIDNFFGMTGGTINILSSDFQIELKADCGNWILLTESPSSNIITKPAGSITSQVIEPGIYLVGVDIAPGIYRNDGNSDSCYWKKTDNVGEIIDNFFGMTGGTINILSSDFQIELKVDCGNWSRISD